MHKKAPATLFYSMEKSNGQKGSTALARTALLSITVQGNQLVNHYISYQSPKWVFAKLHCNRPNDSTALAGTVTRSITEKTIESQPLHIVPKLKASTSELYQNACKKYKIWIIEVLTSMLMAGHITHTTEWFEALSTGFILPSNVLLSFVAYKIVFSCE